MGATDKQIQRSYYGSLHFWKTALLLGSFGFGSGLVAQFFGVDLGWLWFFFMVVVGAYLDFQARIAYHHDCAEVNVDSTGA